MASSSRQTFYWAILSVVGVAVVGAAFYIVFMGRAEAPQAPGSQDPQFSSIAQLEEEEPGPSEQDEATADWQVYRNESLGFEIKYPKNWETELLYDFNLSFKKKGDKKFYELKSGDYLTFYYPDLRVSVGRVDETDIRKYQEAACEKSMQGIGACSQIVEETVLAGARALKMIHCVEAANREGYMMIKNGYLFSLTTPYLCVIDPNRLEYSKTEQDIISQYKALEARYAPIHKEILESFKFIK